MNSLEGNATMRLIGLHSRMTGGKDTAYNTIEREAENQGLLALRRAFADPLKVSGMRALGVFSGTDDSVALANKIKETGKIVVVYDEVSETGNIVPMSIMLSGREYWQYYGTEAHRADDLGHSFGMDFWVDNLLPLGTETVTDYENNVFERPLFWHSFQEGWAGYADLSVITDVRFPNEAERIHAVGGELWKIDADERLGANTQNHSSETPLDDKYIDRVIDNNGTLAQFQQNILDALHS